MKFLSVICILALTNLSHALNLQLSFNETSFEINTSGTFTLTGEIPMWGIGWSSDESGITSYTFGTQYRGSNTANLPNDYYFTLDSYDASGNSASGWTYPSCRPWLSGSLGSNF